MNDRLNWGLVTRLEPDEQIKVVRAWLEAHQPSDDGYAGAARWLSRRRENTPRIEIKLARDEDDPFEYLRRMNQ